jgi:hypothetical protein
MDVKALKNFNSTLYGEIQAGQIFDCKSGLAHQWAAAGMVELVKPTEYETKVVVNTPKVGDVPLVSGRERESGLSQAAPASPKKTPKSSKAKGR